MVKYIITRAYQGSSDQLCKQISTPRNFRVLLHHRNGPLTLKQDQTTTKYFIERHKEIYSKLQSGSICLILPICCIESYIRSCHGWDLSCTRQGTVLTGSASQRCNNILRKSLIVRSFTVF